MALLHIGKLLGLYLLNRRVSERNVLRGFMGNLTAVVGLTIVTGMMAGTLLLAMVYGGYRFMLAQGTEPDAALFLTAGIVLLLTVISLLVTLLSMRRLVTSPDAIDRHEPNILSQAGDMVEAFISGLTTPLASEVQEHDELETNPPQTRQSRKNASFTSAKI